MVGYGWGLRILPRRILKLLLDRMIEEEKEDRNGWGRLLRLWMWCLWHLYECTPGPPT